MQYIVTKREMKQLDDYATQKIGIPGDVLMERAALQLAEEIERLNPEKRNILIVVEGGNNGGDGLALARILREHNIWADIYYVNGFERVSEQFARQQAILSHMGIIMEHAIPDREYAVIVDGIFGVGLSKTVEGIHSQVIEMLNDMPGIKVAIDIPSGIDATTGKILGTAFHADYTVTFGYKKLGMFLADGAEYCGKILCKEIGIPKQAVDEVCPQVYAYDASDIHRLPKRVAHSNKGTYGKVAVIAGSKNMSGAAFLCAKAAYATGVGLVKIYTHESNRLILQSQLPEAIMMTYEDYEGALLCMEDAMRWATVVVVGPGMGVDITSERMLYELLMNAEIPLVLDADALNMLSNNIELLKTTSRSIVMTPHMMEMSRLVQKPVEEVKEHRFEIAASAAKKLQVTLVLKDARSIVTDGGSQTYINLYGNSGMSTGGSGDVLSGMIAGMIAGGLPLMEAAKMGNYVHGLAGDLAAEKKGAYAMLASDIISCIGEVMKHE